MTNSLTARTIAVNLFMCLVTHHSRAFDVQVSYDLDDGSFFQSANRRASLEAAIGVFENLLQDDLAAIEPTIEDSWNAVITHPYTGEEEWVLDLVVPANTLILYVGARDLSGLGKGVLAHGGSGLNATGSQPWIDTVLQRGEGPVTGPLADDFATWGGAISFNTLVNWHDDHATAPSNGEIDLYSVALHEIGHLLGFGRMEIVPDQATSWSNLIEGGRFNGPRATAEFGGIVPLSLDREDWAIGTPSVVYGTNAIQDAAMSQLLLPGARKELTELDVAALLDIGWQLHLSSPFGAGDYNGDGAVTAADYSVWRDTMGSESDLRADGNGDLQVDEDDYRIWRAAYVNALNTATGAANRPHSVPEPTFWLSAPLLWLSLLVMKSARL